MAAATTVKARPAALQILIKHHFWMLAVLVPIVLLPLVFMALGKLRTDITAMQGQIEGSITSLKNVRMIPQHPNSSWSNDIDQSTVRVKRETYAEWVRFWNSQKAFRSWPASLGADFVKAAENLKPDGKLSRQLLERYQNNVKQLVQELPTRMGVEPAMLDPAALAEMQAGSPSMQPPGFPPGISGGPGRGGDPSQPGARPQQPAHVAVWSPENQKRIYGSFVWDKAPTTLKVVMAQEELRVYGVFCDLIARMNKPATGPHNAAIAAVSELYVGYLAAEDDYGGAAAGRLTRLAAAGPGGGMAMGSSPEMAMGQPGGAAGGRPPHPRFGAGVSPGMGMAGSMSPMDGGGDQAAAAAGPTDEQLLNWVYCDFSGKPLDAATLATAPDAQMVHLMPFVMKLTIDQRQVDALLVELATATLPVDVRQVRINASGAPGIGGMMGGMGSMPGYSSGMGPEPGYGGMGGMPVDSATGAARLYDVQLEVRGTIGLATRPNEQAVGLEPGQGAAPATGEGKAAPAKSAAARWNTRRRAST